MIQPRILSSINQDEFFGRDAEVRDILRQSSSAHEGRGLVLMSTPDAGASELLRQAYDQLFARRGDPVPIHFAFRRSDATAANTARRFFQTLLQQYVAYRRVNPALCKATLTFHDLMELALPSDYELINNLIEGFQREQASERTLIDFCFSVPNRLQAEGRAIYPLIDYTRIGPFKEEVATGHQLLTELSRGRLQFVLAGLRRQTNDLIHGPDGGEWEANATLHVNNLSESSAQALLESLARRYGVELNAPTRDLIIQQLNCSPLFLTEFMRAARTSGIKLTSFLACQRLYVDELLGGRIQRHFDRTLQVMAPSAQVKKTLLRVLYESAMSETRKSSLWAWKKRLGVDAHEFENVIEALHVYELINSTAAFIEVNSESYVWMDYLRAHYRVEVAAEPRARVVATTLLETLKRAPQTMTRKYRREAAVGLHGLLPQFNCQSVPASLFHYDSFAAAYKGEDVATIDDGLDSETDLIQLPQVIQTAACASYASTINCDYERCVVAHAFESAEYTDENEVVWLAAEIDSKLEASRELTEEWCNRLAGFARESGFARYRIWLIAPEGFSERATEVLNEREAFGSSRQQVQLLAGRLRSDTEVEKSKADEYEIIIPMGADTELIAAYTVEKIARRVNFRPEAINQIKTAVIEACINAAEHSLSPDRKIYQRFVVEDDKLVVTVASRGVVPAQAPGQNGQSGDVAQSVDQDGSKTRRGWGLKLIKTLMDEVEFEHVDDGTQLRMTKYLR
jgi:serine/threonine-protein kinase RsbW